MKVGDLVVIVWTEDTKNSATPVCGIVTKMEWVVRQVLHPVDREVITVYCEGKHLALERGDLRVVVG